MIDQQAFVNCVSLGGVVFPEGLAAISSQAFYNCRGISRVTFPSTIVAMGSEIFYSCYCLKTADFRRLLTIPSLANANAFGSTPNDLEIVVPDEFYQQWTTAAVWSSLSSKMKAASESSLSSEPI